MTKFKIEKGVSRVARVKLQVAIDESVAQELALLCEWSNNEKNYVVNELLRFALTQDSEFQTYKQSMVERPSDAAAQPRSIAERAIRKDRLPTESDRTVE